MKTQRVFFWCVVVNCVRGHTCVDRRLIGQSVSSGLDKRRHEAQFDVVLLQESVLVKAPHFLNVADAQNTKTIQWTASRVALFKIRVAVAHLMSTSLKVVSMAQVL